jgi:hypothetical protein
MLLVISLIFADLATAAPPLVSGSSSGEVLPVQAWRFIQSGAPSARRYHTAVWTGTEMIVWGGSLSPDYFPSDGGRYRPSTDSWTPVSSSNAPAPRFFHTAVWTGSEMIVWGGMDDDLDPLGDGARYNPATDSWTPMSTTGAPSARYGHTAIWTGSEMIVWGG